ncbi:MAG TPA: peptidase M28 family protein, partial [Thermoanaerobaculia bacterium]|nr:peptidase M28 family protein [Thermoanaerobaculia bacterium]
MPPISPNPVHRSRRAARRLTATAILLVVVSLATFTAAVAAPQAPAGGEAARIAAATALRDRALGDTTAYAFVRDLTTEIGARPAGSAADRAAVAWAAERLGTMGFDRVWTEEVTVPHWVRGAERGAILDPFPVEVRLAALGGSVGTPEEGVTAEVVMVEDVDALAALPEGAVAGRIVFFNDRMERGRTGAGYGATVGIRGVGAREAWRRG